LRSKHLHQAVDRFRHDSGFFKIMAHAVYKTYAMLTAAVSASYIIIFVGFFVTFSLLILAALNYLLSGRCLRCTASWNLPILITSSCKLLAFMVCLSLPIFIQQGDIDSDLNRDPTKADASCVFFYSQFPRSKGSLKTDYHCSGSSFWTEHTRHYFTGDYPTVFYLCPLRMSRTTLYSPALQFPTFLFL
jgi:hypothetical protein